MKKTDFWLIAVVLMAAAVIFLLTQNFSLRGDFVTVTLNGKIIGSYPLAEPVEIELSDEKGGYNRLVIAGGAAYIEDADCPDKLCVRQRAVCSNGESIICLPHKIAVTVTAAGEAPLDAVAN